MARPDVLTTPAEASRVADEWRDLSERLAVSYFASPDWVIAWWEAFAGGGEAEVALWRGPSGALEAVVGLARHREPVHPRFPLPISVWTNLGSGAGAADHCAWTVAPYRLDDVRAWVLDRAGRRPVLLRDLDPELGAPAVPPGARLTGRSRCPRVEISADEAAAGPSSRFRKHLRQDQRKADAMGLEFRWIAPREMTMGILDRLLELHGERRAMLGGSTTFDRSRLPFQERLLDLGDGSRGPAAMVADRAGEIVGIVYGFLWRDEFAHYQTGWEPELERIGLGNLLVSHAIRAAGEAGARRFDMLRGVEPYKYRFGASDRVDETWLVPTGVSGKVLLTKYRAKDRIARSRQLQ